MHPPRGWTPEGALVVPGYRGRKLRIAVRTVLAVVQDVTVDDEQVLVDLGPVPGGAVPDGWVQLRRLDASTGVTARVEQRDERAVAVFPAGSLEVTSRSLNVRAWRFWFVPCAARRPTRPPPRRWSTSS